MTLRSFKTHSGEVFTGAPLEAALSAVAEDWAALGRRIRKADNYAEHVTEEQKDTALERMLTSARRISEGHVESLTIAQRLNEKPTGECVSLLPPA